jgi:succinoglycan biosynthesis protein ExoU
MDTRTSIAVIIAAYGSEKLIARAVRSALAQPEAGEVIVVVDASPDATAAAARAAGEGDPRLIIIEQAVNQGPAAARNAGIRASRSPWITVLDDDDFMEPGRLGRLLALDQGFDFIADDLLLAAEGAETGPRTPMWFQGSAAPELVSLAAFVRANCPDPLRPRRELGFLKPLMRRAFLETHDLAYDEGMRLGEDYDLYARALAAGARFLLVPAQGYVAVRRPDSLSGRHGAAELQALRGADDRLLRRSGLSAETRAALRIHRRSSDKRYQWQRLIDAVKAGDPAEAAAAFCSDARVTVHLLGQLWRQARLRILGGG